MERENDLDVLLDMPLSLISIVFTTSPTKIYSDPITIFVFINISAIANSLINTINTDTDVDDDIGAFACVVSGHIVFVIWEGNWFIEFFAPGFVLLR